MQGTNVANNETELTESNAQHTNVPNSLTELKEKSAQSTNVTIKDNSRKTVHKTLT